MKPGSRPSDLPDRPSDHFDGKRFFNPQRSARRRGDLLTWLRTRERIAWRPTKPEPIPDSPPLRSETLRVTWINHSTVLIQIAGQNILTDPVYSDRVSPFSSLGPRRHHPPGVAFDNLPPIDTVLISHAHYDHLDRATIDRLIARDNPLFVAGLGLKQWFERRGTRRITTIDWWQTAPATKAAVTISGVPARHWSRRGLLDRNRSLWLGYWLAHPDHGSVYFAGDTGYGPHFRAIRERLGVPTVALLPIGAYEPRWFMAPQHMNPADAVTAHRDLCARRSIGIHFGTFKLTDEGRLDPVTALAAACLDQGLDAGDFIAPSYGHGYDVGSPRRT